MASKAEKAYLYSGLALLVDSIISIGQRNVVFIWIPKTAGTSLTQTMGVRKLKTLRSIRYRFCGRGRVTFGHVNYAELLSNGYVSKSFDKRSYKFSIIRNPYDRAVSLYMYLKRKGILDESMSFLNFCQKLVDEGVAPIGLYNTAGLSQCNPQTVWLNGLSDVHLFRYESLADEIQELSKQVGITTTTLPRLNATLRRDWRTYYCPKSLDIVSHFYKSDFDQLGYEIINSL